jgi:riboflavin synthase
MFTGIIQHVGQVRVVRPGGGALELAIDLGPLAEALAVGASVAVDGACLTAAAIDEAVARFDVGAETLAVTTLKSLRAGDRVNLERALRVGDGLDGHWVQGHVDGTAAVAAVRQAPQWVIEFAAEKSLTDAMVPKGSIAIDGVSLTLVDVADGRFSVALIPATLEATTLGQCRSGQKVNIETDILGKYVRRALGEAGGGGGLTLEKLRQAGFV